METVVIIFVMIGLVVIVLQLCGNALKDMERELEDMEEDMLRRHLMMIDKWAQLDRKTKRLLEGQEDEKEKLRAIYVKLLQMENNM